MGGVITPFFDSAGSMRMMPTAGSGGSGDSIPCTAEPMTELTMAEVSGSKGMTRIIILFWQLSACTHALT